MTPRNANHARRDFIGQIATGAAALAGITIAAPFASAEASTSPTFGPVSGGDQTSGTWDDSWTARLKGKRNAVFDSPEVNEALALSQADATMEAYKEVLGLSDAEMGMVIVIRHRAIIMAFNDFIWNKYDLGAQYKQKDPTTGEPAKRNPFLRGTKDDKFSMVDPTSSLEALHNRGVTLLGCNRAAMGFAYRLATKAATKVADVQEELKANLVPGMILLPNGIFAVVRAQDAGCAYMPAWYKLNDDS